MSTPRPELTVVGDVMPGRKVGQSLARIGLEKSAAIVRSVLGGGLVVGNLECPLSDERPACAEKDDGGPNLFAPPRMAGWLAQAGFGVMSLANNHAMDCGAAGLLQTLDALRRAGIVPVGAGRNLNEAIQPATVSAGGARVAICAFGNGQAAGGASPGVSPFSSDALRRSMSAVPADAGAIVVLVHGGLEFLEYPESWIRDFAAEAVSLGADAVICGHSHCIRGIGAIGGKPVAYGTGDFMMDTAAAELLEAHLARTALTRIGLGVAEPAICRRGLMLRLALDRPHAISVRAEHLVIGEDFLPRLAGGPWAADAQAALARLSAGVKDGPDRERMKQIEKAYRSVYGNARSWRWWLTLPARIRPRHAAMLLRRLAARGA